MRTALNRRARRARDDAGFAIVLVALLLVFLMVVAAIVVDLVNAREQNRQAVAAADAGALAGAQSISTGTMPTVCATPQNNVYCLTAWHTLASANYAGSASAPGASVFSSPGTCTLETVQASETCQQYVYNGTTVDVKNPYVFGSDPTKYASYVHVKVCWNESTTFARVIGTNSINVCGAATAFNSGNGGSGGGTGGTNDCSVEDNFTDSGGNPVIYVFNPGDWQDAGSNNVLNLTKGNQTAKNNEILAEIYNGHGTELDTSSIVWTAPTTVSGPTNPPVNGNVVQLPRIIPQDNHGPKSGNAHGIGYVLESLDTAGKVHTYDPVTYPASAGNLTLIAYQLPDDGHLQVGGHTYTYVSNLHVNDSQNTANPPTRCGNATWTFTHDGNIASACTENSFFAFTPTPASNQIVAGQTIIQAYYVDESPIENIDTANWPGNSGFPASPNFGINLNYTLNGTTTQVVQYSSTIDNVNPNPDNGQYWLVTSDAQHTSDHYNTTIKWKVPSTFANGTYTINLKAFDTDHPGGGDCGIAAWTVTVTGGNSGSVNLVE